MRSTQSFLMPVQNSDTFNQRLSQWVANQGFWFQVRHSMATGGTRSVVLGHLLRFAARLGVFLLLAFVVAVVWVIRLPGTAGFQQRLEASINRAMGAEETKLGGFQRTQGEMLIRRFASEGGPDTFFSSLEARDIKGRMGLFDVLSGRWRLAVVAVPELNIQLNAGADDAESAGHIAEVVFQEMDSAGFETVDVARANIRWGFSERARGAITDSHVRFNRQPAGWRIQATGGEFSQGWLKRLQIVELDILATPEGLVFQKAEFRKGQNGVVRMDGLKLMAGASPELKGTIRASRLPLDDLIPTAARDFMSGAVSGELTVSGSTNSEEGLAMEGEMTVDQESSILLRDRIYLLRALSEFAVYNTFKSVEFTEGSFHMKIKGGGMELTKLDLKAWDSKDLERKGECKLTMTGQMKARLPSREEANTAVERNRSGSPIADSSYGPGVDSDVNINLKRAGGVLQKEKGKAGLVAVDAGEALFERIGQSFQARVLADQEVERQSRTFIYEGGFMITVPAETFENTAALREQYPVDPQTGRISLEVPIKGGLFDLTLEQTEELYRRGKKY